MDHEDDLKINTTSKATLVLASIVISVCIGYMFSFLIGVVMHCHKKAKMSDHCETDPSSPPLDDTALTNVTIVK